MKNNTKAKKNNRNIKTRNKVSNDQNEKIALITDTTMVIGVDVGSENHYARAFTNRGIELSRKPFKFRNDESGFETFENWAVTLMNKNGMKVLMVGMEPTGHYWYSLADYVKKHGMVLVQVNPAAVKKSKELDDNNPVKSDRKDPKVIAGLVNDGRYSFPYLPEGIYAELRELSNQRLRASEELTRAKNRFARWIAIYFPEYKEFSKELDNVSGAMILKVYPLPADIEKAGVEGILEVWRKHKLRGAGASRKRAEKLYEAARNSIGRKTASNAARMELKDLLDDLEMYGNRVDRITEEAEELLLQVPNATKLLDIEGVGISSVMTFVAEVGNINRMESAKAVQKLAGLAIVSNSSGKHNGRSNISYRGRKTLRLCIYRMALSLVRQNKDFKVIHEYYTTRKENPLKKMQSLIAVGCKALRIFYKILKDGVTYDGQKMMSDIIRPETA